MRIKSEVKKLIRDLVIGNKRVAKIVKKAKTKTLGKRKEKNVVVFHPGRCGSSVLGSLLNQHPKIGWIGEIFKRSYEKYKWIKENPYEFVKFRKDMCMSSVFGMEIVTEELLDERNDIKRITGPLEKIGFDKFVLLKRNNLLSRLVSSLVAEKIGRWNTKKNIEAPKVKVPNNKKDIIGGFKKYEKFYKNIENEIGPKESIILSYERDIRPNPKIAYKKMCKFLELEEVEVSLKLKKINKKHIRERILNLSDVDEMLENTKYEWMLHRS